MLEIPTCKCMRVCDRSREEKDRVCVRRNKAENNPLHTHNLPTRTQTAAQLAVPGMVVRKKGARSGAFGASIGLLRCLMACRSDRFCHRDRGSDDNVTITLSICSGESPASFSDAAPAFDPPP